MKSLIAFCILVLLTWFQAVSALMAEPLSFSSIVSFTNVGVPIPLERPTDRTSTLRPKGLVLSLVLSIEEVDSNCPSSGTYFTVFSNAERSFIFSNTYSDRKIELSQSYLPVGYGIYDVYVVVPKTNAGACALYQLPGVKTSYTCFHRVIGTRLDPWASSQAENLFGVLNRESKLPSLGIEALYGKYATVKTLLSVLKRTNTAELGFFWMFVEVEKTPFGFSFLAAEDNNVLNNRIPLEQLFPFRGNSVFIWLAKLTNSDEKEFQTYLNAVGLSSLVLTPEWQKNNDFASGIETFYRSKYSVTPEKSFQTLGDLKKYLLLFGDLIEGGQQPVMRLTDALSQAVLRSYKWIPGATLTNSVVVPIFSEITNTDRKFTLKKNFVVYEAIESGGVSRLQTDQRIDKTFSNTLGHWEE
jgi:hypothetical protein